MRNLIHIAILDLRIFLGSWSNIISITVLPIALAVLLGGATGGDSGPSAIRVDLIDQDNTPQSAQFIADLRAINGTLVLCPADQTEDNICLLDEAQTTLSVTQSLQRLGDEMTNAVIIIPVGYSAALEDFAPVEIGYYSRADALTGDIVRQSVETVVQRVNGAIIAARVGEAYVDTLAESLGGPVLPGDEDAATFTGDVYSAAADSWRAPSVDVVYIVSGEGVQNGAVPGGFQQSVPGMATMFVLFTALGGIYLLLAERKLMTLARLVAMPVSRLQIIGGKILSRFILCMVQFLIVFAVGVVVGLDFGNDPVALFVVMAAFALAATALALALATVIESEPQAAALSTLLSLALAALGGAWWPLELPFIPDFMRTIAYLSPVTYAMNGFNQVLFYGGGLVDVLAPVGILLAIAAALFALGIANFRYE